MSASSALTSASVLGTSTDLLFGTPAPSANPAPPWIALDGFFLTAKYSHAVNQYLLRKIDLRTRLRVQGDVLIFIGTNKKLPDDAQRSDLDEIQGRRRARSRLLQQESRRSADNDPHRREHRRARHRRDAQDAHPRYGGGHRRHHRFGHEARLLTDDDHLVDSNQAPIQWLEIKGCIGRAMSRHS